MAKITTHVIMCTYFTWYGVSGMQYRYKGVINPSIILLPTIILLLKYQHENEKTIRKRRHLKCHENMKFLFNFFVKKVQST